MAINDRRQSRSKRHRNSLDEPQISSKRHKHHSSRYNAIGACANETQPVTQHIIVSHGDSQLNYDKEEGEIIDIGADNSTISGCSDHIMEEVSVFCVEDQKGKGESSLRTYTCDGVELKGNSIVQYYVNGSHNFIVNDQILKTSKCNRDKSWKERDRERERSRRKQRDRARERDRVRDKERRDREHTRDRGRNGDREEEGVRNSCHLKFQDVHTGGDIDRHNDNMHQRSVDKEYRQRSRTNGKERICSSGTDNSEMDAQRLPRDEVEHEDHQEIVMHTAEQEEGDLNRIKEESRRRKQVILEKFKAQLLQQKPGLKSEETVKESAKQPSKSVGEAQSSPNESAHMFLDDAAFPLHMSPEQTEPPALKISGFATLREGTSKSKGSDDMFSDDIFGDSSVGIRKQQGEGDRSIIVQRGPQDNWDDDEGYYKYKIKELLDGRYEVVSPLGKGVFSNVVYAKDLKAGPGNPDMVAIKIIRSNDTMCKAGLEELVILNKLVDADMEDRQHCVRLLSSFKYNHHFCLVFESLDMNLRQYLKKFGRDIGLDLTDVRKFAKQLFIALKHLKNCRVLHSDIKPDNMLVNEANKMLKLSDFGSAMFSGENEITPYLVSRFYRAPEIILGLTYDHPMDIWSAGCCLYELYTHEVLFPGTSNNEMLRLHMELRGPFPKKMLRKGAFTNQHFDRDLNFLGTEMDPFTKKAVTRLIRNFVPKDFSTILKRSAGEDPKMFANFKDLLHAIFVLDPEKRITVSQALSHPFITGK